MHNILCLNKISPLGTDRLGENYTYAAEIENPEHFSALRRHARHGITQ